MKKFKNYNELTKLFNIENRSHKWITKVFQTNMLVFSLLVFCLYTLNGKNAGQLNILDKILIGAFLLSFTVFIITFILMGAREKAIHSGSKNLRRGFVDLLKNVIVFIFLPSFVITISLLLYMYLINN